jgi:hypothetical protein
MSSAFVQTNISTAPLSVGPNCSVMMVGDEAGLSQAEVNAAQAIAAYRRIDEAENDASANVHNDALSTLSIDDLRQLAFDLQVPDRSRITDKAELIAEIRRRF